MKNPQNHHSVGLSTVKKLVEELGGQINVQSELGEYARFTFTLKKHMPPISQFIIPRCVCLKLSGYFSP